MSVCVSLCRACAGLPALHYMSLEHKVPALMIHTQKTTPQTTPSSTASTSPLKKPLNPIAPVFNGYTNGSHSNGHAVLTNGMSEESAH